MMWSREQLLHWHRVFEKYREDSSQTTLHCDIGQQRQRAQQEMLQLLSAFLAGEITLKEFNSTFQQRTHGAWNIFHIRGRSGGMFLNKLVKHIPDEEHFAQLLRAVLRLPKDVAEGHWWMQAFVRFLEGIIVDQQATLYQLQPAHVPFFLSIWWHIQATEQWPIPYPTVRTVIISEHNKDTSQEILRDPIERYFVFRSLFISLSNDLGLIFWEAEHLLTWYTQKQSQIARVNQQGIAHHNGDQKTTLALLQQTNTASIQVEASQNIAVVMEEQASLLEERYSGSCLTHIQWLLAKLGSKIGCQVWVRSTDHRKTWQNERLGTLSIPTFPTLAEPSLQQVIEQIDVLWLRDNKIVAAYEIEQTHTDVSVGLLRLLDMSTLTAEDMHLCMVIPQNRFEKVCSELQRPIFQKQNHQQQCRLINQEVLLQHAEHILRWARNLHVIDDLTSLSVSAMKSASSVNYNLTDNEPRKIGV